jgi:hypothetical protein
MGDLLTRVGENLLGRVHGPLTFRLILQPLTAAIIATRAGIKDARRRHPAYGWAVLANPVARKELLREGWKEVGRVFLFAVVVDLVYEVIELRRIYPGESLIVAAVLALLPYPLIRTLVNLIVRCFGRHEKHSQKPKCNTGPDADGLRR